MLAPQTSSSLILQLQPVSHGRRTPTPFLSTTQNNAIWLTTLHPYCCPTVLLPPSETLVEGECIAGSRSCTKEMDLTVLKAAPAEISFIFYFATCILITPCPFSQAFKAHRFGGSPLTSSTCSSSVCSGGSTSSSLPAFMEALSTISSFSRLRTHPKPTSHLLLI